MSEEVKLVFTLSSEEDTTDVAKTIESLNSIPGVAFTPMSGLFGWKETIQGILSAPKDIPMKAIEKTADTISEYLKSREETKRLRSVELCKGDMVIKLKGDAAREEVIKELTRALALTESPLKSRETATSKKEKSSTSKTKTRLTSKTRTKTTSGRKRIKGQRAN